MTTHITVEIDWTRSSTWVDETPYLRAAQVRVGFDQPGDPVAAVGRCMLHLDNRTRRFSPGNTSGPLYGLLQPRVPVRVTASDGLSTWTLFYGWLDRITPDTGLYGARECVLDAVDGLALLGQQRLGVALQPTQTVAGAVGTVVSAAYSPLSTFYDDNGDTLTHVGRTWLPEQTTCTAALYDICRSVYGRFFLARDGTAIFWSRNRMQQLDDAALNLDDAPVAGLGVALDMDRVLNHVTVTTYPVETVAGESVLWQSQVVLRIPPMSSRVIYAPYRDANGNRCGAVDVVTPVAWTDFTVNDRSDGTGFDYTGSASFSISVEHEATRLKITLVSGATGSLYVTTLRVRGKPLVTYDPVTVQQDDATSQGRYQRRALALDLPMQADAQFGASLATYLVDRFKDPVPRVASLSVRNRDVINGVNLFSLDLMAALRLSDSQTGLDGVLHTLIGVTYDLDPAGHTIHLTLERADERRYWQLESGGSGELALNTVLGL